MSADSTPHSSLDEVALSRARQYAAAYERSSPDAQRHAHPDVRMAVAFLNLFEQLEQRTQNVIDCNERSRALAEKVIGLEEQLEVLREFYEAHWEVEQGIIDFDLHAKAVTRLEVADERVRGLLEEK